MAKPLNILTEIEEFNQLNHFLDHPIPHTAACALNEDGKEAYFALAYQNNLMLFTMNCFNGQTTMVELKESYIVPRILSNLTGALR